MSSGKKKRSSGIAEDVYTVEKIVGRRIKGGRVEYLIKWEGYDEKDNTWEASENVFCDDLVQQYEADHAEDLSTADSPLKAPSSGKKQKKARQDVVIPNCWEDEVDEIMTMERSDNDLIIHIRWKDGSTSAHKSNVVNINCPQKVIHFYEERLRFKTETEDDLDRASNAE